LFLAAAVAAYDNQDDDEHDTADNAPDNRTKEIL
jgi:hypothetical protein